MPPYIATSSVGFAAAPRYPHYPHLTRLMAPEYAEMSGTEIRLVMDSLYGPGAADAYEEYLEGIFGDIGKAFSSAAKDVGKFAVKAAPVVANVGGGALQGALAGSALGPVGIIAGAAAGGTGAGLSTYGKGAAKGVGGVLSGITNIAGQFSPLGRVGAAAAPVLTSLAKGNVKGAATSAIGGIGGVLGGPAGGAGGALGSLLGGGRGGAASALSGLLGGGGGGAASALSSLLGGSGGGAASALSSLLGGGSGGPAANVLGSLLGGGGNGKPAAGSGAAISALTNLFGGGSAAGQLMSLLQRPEAMQALAALRMGPAGKKFIPVGSAQTPVPATAIASLIGELAAEATVEAAAYADGSEAELRYMTDDSGEFVGDPAMVSDRAARVWDLLNLAQAERLAEAVTAYRESEEGYDDGADDGEYEEAAGYEEQEVAYYESIAEDYGEDFSENDGEDYGEDFTESDSEWEEGDAYEYA